MRSIPAIAINMDRTVRGLGRLLLVLLVLAFAWRGAGWLWYFAAPGPNPRVPDLRALVSVANVARFPWFGAVTRSAVAAPVADIRVIGLFAGGKRPAALLAIGSQNPVAVVVGESPAAGVQLVSVADDHIVVLRNGINEKIMLTGSTSALQRNTKGKKDTPNEIQ